MKNIGAVKYRPHPDGLENTIFKIKKLFKVNRLFNEDKTELNKILNEYKSQILDSTTKEINYLKSEVDKFKQLKELLK
jgi:hypothetical protein